MPKAHFPAGMKNAAYIRLVEALTGMYGPPHYVSVNGTMPVNPIFSEKGWYAKDTPQALILVVPNGAEPAIYRAVCVTRRDGHVMDAPEAVSKLMEGERLNMQQLLRRLEA